jgi:flagellar M-ring protein FliF
MAEELTAPAPPPAGNALQEAYARLSNRHRMALLIGVPLLLALIVASLLWTREPDYRVLFSGLSDKDGGAILTALTTQNIPYRMAENGSAVLVPANQVHETRLKLASQGLPRGGSVGFELMENSRLGLTQFQEQVNYQRALEGELARSIQSLGTVQSARVHLAIPKPSIFLREQNKPSASVLVQLYNGRALDRGQVEGIVHLVSSSVPELTPSSVSIIDQNGNLLSVEAKTNGLDSTQIQYVHELERQYQQRITALLNPIVGSANVRAQVAVDVDFSQLERTEETFKPNTDQAQASIRSMQTSDSSAPGNQAQMGVPGALTNTPGGNNVTAPITGAGVTNPNAPQTPAQAAAAATAATAAGQTQIALAQANRSTQRANTTNYEVDKSVVYTREPTGRIRRLTAAVVVNNRNTEVDGKAVSTPLTKAEIDQINAVVREAVGASNERRDSVSVVNMPFNAPTDANGPELPLWQQPWAIDLAKSVGLALLIAGIALYLIFGVIRPAVRQLTAPPPPPEPVADTNQIDLTGIPGAVESDELSLVQGNDPLDSARQLARDNPEAVANVLRQWVNGGTA